MCRATACSPSGRPSARLQPLSIPDRTVFEKPVQVLVFGCVYMRLRDHENTRFAWPLSRAVVAFNIARHVGHRLYEVAARGHSWMYVASDRFEGFEEPDTIIPTELRGDVARSRLRPLRRAHPDDTRRDATERSARLWLGRSERDKLRTERADPSHPTGHPSNLQAASQNIHS